MITGMAIAAWLFVVAAGYTAKSLFDLASNIL
jgi:hypothetical protein